MAPVVIDLASLLVHDTSNIAKNNTEEECFTCGKTGAQTHGCETCGATYCRKKCQRDDFVLHNLFCKQMGDFLADSKPTPHHYRALGFAADDENPALIWVEGLEAPCIVTMESSATDEPRGAIADKSSSDIVQRGDRVIVACTILGGELNRAAFNLSGKPGHAWIRHGHVIGLVMKKDSSGSVVGVDDLTARDFRDVINAMRSSVRNVAILPEHVPLHDTSCVRALKFNDEATVKGFEEMGLTIPEVEEIWVPTSLKAGESIDEYCYPLSYPFFVGLKWYVRRAPYSEASLARIQNLQDRAESARSIHPDARILRNFMRVEYSDNGMPTTLYPNIGHLAGPVIVLHSSGARIDHHHVCALLHWASNVDPDNNKVENDFRKYWEIYKADQVQKGLMSEDLESPFDLQDAAGPALVFADRRDMKNPDRMKICLDIFRAKGVKPTC